MYDRGYHFIGQVKTGHLRFPKLYLEDLMQDFPSGLWVVLEATGLNKVPLVAIGYKYNTRKVLSFVMTKGCGSLAPGVPYDARYCDANHVVHVREMSRPSVLTKFL